MHHFTNRNIGSPSSRRHFSHRTAALALALAVGACAAAAGPASARERHNVTGPGVSGQAVFDDGRLSAGLRGWVRDPSNDGACAEVWMDFATRPHHHFDAYVVRTCGYGRSGWGRYNKVGHPWGWTINGVRTAACRYWRDGSRTCTQQWPHDAVRAGTFNVQTV